MVWVIIIVVIAVIIAIAVDADKKEKEKIALMAPDEKQNYLAEKQRRAAEAAKRNQDLVATSQFGPLNSAMVCPHCQSKGKVRTKHITQKKGISGGKATAAVLTGGLSVLAVGLSRKEANTQAHCDNCGSTWLF
jgi:hypothetical protein